MTLNEFEAAMHEGGECPIKDRKFDRVLAQVLPEVITLVRAVTQFNANTTVSFDLTRGPGSQRVYEIDELFVKNLEYVLAAFEEKLSRQ